jgi:hypothetical protein
MKKQSKKEEDPSDKFTTPVKKQPVDVFQDEST